MAYQGLTGGAYLENDTNFNNSFVFPSTSETLYLLDSYDSKNEYKKESNIGKRGSIDENRKLTFDQKNKYGSQRSESRLPELHNRATIFTRTYIKSSGTLRTSRDNDTGELKRAEKISSQRSKNNNNTTLPSYYNKKMMNSRKYAEQLRKRRLLWRKAKNNDDNGSDVYDHKPSIGTFWQRTTLGDGQDGKMTAKFKRLMGIKNSVQEDTSSLSKVSENGTIMKQKEIFESMESQYEAARLATHTQRGVGLGFRTFLSGTQ